MAVQLRTNKGLISITVKKNTCHPSQLCIWTVYQQPTRHLLPHDLDSFSNTLFHILVHTICCNNNNNKNPHKSSLFLSKGEAGCANAARTLGGSHVLLYLSHSLSWQHSAARGFGGKVNFNHVSGSKAYAFGHYRDFMFCSVFPSVPFHAYMKILQHPELLRFSFFLESITDLLEKHPYAWMSYTVFFVSLYVISMYIYIFL